MPARFESGFFVREPAWHGLGTVLDKAPTTWAEARKAAKLDWEPIPAPVFGFQGLDKDGKVTYDPSQAVAVKASMFKQIEDRQRVVRSGSHATLGVPTTTYEVINHEELGAIVKALDGQPDVVYETTVVLAGGKQIAVVIRLNKPVTIKGDVTQTYPLLGLTASHSGDGSVRAQATGIRIVCGNTFSMAEADADRTGLVYQFAHKGNWRDHIEEAQAAIRGLRREFDDYVDFATELSKVKVSREQEKLFLERFIPMPITAAVLSDRQIQNIDDARATVLNILAHPDTIGRTRGTAYGLLQAGTEYLDWYLGGDKVSQASRFKAQILKPRDRKRELVRIVREVVAA